MMSAANKDMRPFTLYLSVLCLLVGLWALFTAQSLDSLQMIRPVATGAAGTGLHANNRVYRAYPGITYSIHADARGGRWPYTYSLSNAPAGMTIEAGPCTTIGESCTAGTITWVNPTSTASDIVVTVRDANGSEVTGTWSVTVGTSGFCFLDAVSGNDTTGSGTLASPWQTLTKARASCGDSDVLYFRAGTYATEQQSGMSSWDWREGVSGPVIWLCSPSETCTINFRSDSTSYVSQVRLWGSNIYVDGFRMDNVGSIGFQLVRDSDYGAVLRNITGLDLLDGEDGLNSAYIMWQSDYNSPSYFDTVQNSTFAALSGDGGIDDGDGGATEDDGCALKIYSVRYGLFETSTYSGTGFEEARIAIKSEVPDFTVRANQSTADVLTFIGGNMDDGTGSPHLTSGEVYHNLCLGSGTTSGAGCITLAVAIVSPPGPIEVYRNTFIGKLNFTQNVNSNNDGPYTFNDNVILNGGGSGGSCPAPGTCHDDTGPSVAFDFTRYVMNADNVQGANDDSIANATTGELVPGSPHLGVAGYQLSASSGPRFVPGFLKVAKVHP